MQKIYCLVLYARHKPKKSSSHYYTCIQRARRDKLTALPLRCAKTVRHIEWKASMHPNHFMFNWMRVELHCVLLYYGCFCLYLNGSKINWHLLPQAWSILSVKACVWWHEFLFTLQTGYLGVEVNTFHFGKDCQCPLKPEMIWILRKRISSLGNVSFVRTYHYQGFQ